MKKDITSLDDVKLMVDTFYQRVRENELLGPIFNERLNNRWPEHLEKMYRFWQTILLDEHTYHGAPFPPHAAMALSKAHFETWLNIFVSTVDELFEGEVANEAKHRGTLMAAIFNSKIEYLSNIKS
ncbi:MAG: globin [Bacteroidetes bacterium]|nr:globin [Bacteroidota bacterium]